MAELAVHPLQDVLGLNNEARMNLPGIPAGYWEWRLQWRQIPEWRTSRLREVSAILGRRISGPCLRRTIRRGESCLEPGRDV